MKKKTTLSEEDQALFRQLMAGTRKIKQDTIVHRPQRKKISEVPVKRLIQEQADASHYFSDEFQPLLNTEGDAPRDKCALSCAINGIHAAFHYLKKNYISGSVMTVPTG